MFKTEKKKWAFDGVLNLFIQYGSNPIASWSEFARDIGKIQHRLNHNFFIKVDQVFLKRHYWSTSVVPDLNFSKDAWNRNKTWVLMETYKVCLKGQYGCHSILSFDQDLPKIF